ncbi:prophage pi2 protein 40 [Lysinibacillus sphaericus]|uniref:hypothetical protein n=1 Tax=Lysinibacillus sphaericus TaxID=1421 RepID=UPI0018CFBB36|nr:hypothetical protein [Lysinibacillus sphaericus]MBG9453313.1 prophage pi2 protein 40 [Lysinibacillus sphaericus]MBG9477083.1 prophage pi2 protein 40 [Lysinibacillus sphaericus]MBG9591165.1 prophage pi2 protein 40 [Lysinibacillus sphaericus]MBG9592017.1 prophage pi2 protein 40 [Lysinibacillus sphaericus]
MEKTLTIDNKQVRFKSSGAVPKRYKMQFGRDFFKDLIGMGIVDKDYSNLPENEQFEAIRKIDFDLFYDIAWTLAKTADNTIEDPLTWLDSFETFPIVDIVSELQDILAATISSKKN